jgi:hypothetical protein
LQRTGENQKNELKFDARQIPNRGFLIRWQEGKEMNGMARLLAGQTGARRQLPKLVARDNGAYTLRKNDRRACKRTSHQLSKQPPASLLLKNKVETVAHTPNRRLARFHILICRLIRVSKFYTPSNLPSSSNQ